MTRRIILVDIGAGLTLRGVLPSVALFATYSATLKAAGGQAPYTYSLASGALPAGLYLDAATGIISGTAGTAGTASFTVRVTDLSGAYVDRAFSITVIAEPLSLSGTAQAWTVGTPYSYTYTAANGVPPYTWSLAAGALPAGLALDTGTGTISGTPTAPNAPAWTVRVTDSAGTSIDLRDNGTLQLLGAFAAATVGTAYSSDLPINGGDLPYSNPRVIAGALPAGLALSIVGDKLRLSGTPTAAATSDFTVAAHSGDGQTATSAQSVVVGDAQKILDMLATQSVAAYSLRKLRSAYVGAAVKVSRSSPSALLDIGFDASGNLDSAALLAFLGSSTGTIDTWYDQSGNGLHVIAAASAQPRIATGGVVDAFNGVPALYFDGANYLNSTVASTLISATGWSANAVAKPTVYAATPQTILDQDNYPTAGKRIAQFLRFSSTSIEAVAFNTAPTAFVADSPANSPAVLTAICSTSGVTAYGDGAAGSTVAFSGAMNTTPAAFRVGQSLVNGGSTSFAGKCCEVVAFSAPLSTTDRHTLERDQGARYGVAVA